MGSGGGGGGGNPALLMQNAAPMQGLPVAGKDSTIGSPYEYGKFQNFLPDIPAEGPAPSATGLRPDMFQYRSPSGVVAQSDVGNQIQQLRDALAKLQSQGSGGGSSLSTGVQWPNDNGGASMNNAGGGG